MKKIKGRAFPTLSSWDEADELLGKVVAAQREKERIELALNKRIDTLKQNAKLASEEAVKVIDDGHMRLNVFAEMHREDFGKARTRKLTHGVIGWQKNPPSVKLVGKVEDTIKKLLAMGKTECVKQTAPKLDKEKAKLLTEEELTEAGIVLEAKDEFICKAQTEELPDLSGGAL